MRIYINSILDKLENWQALFPVYNYTRLPRLSTDHSFYHNQLSAKYWLWGTLVFLFLLKSKLTAIFRQINAIWHSIFGLLYSNVVWVAANRARFGEQLTYDNPILLHNFMDFPSCSPHIPIFRSFLVVWPLSLENIIISPTPSSSFAAYGLLFIISYSRYCGKKLLESSILIPSVVWVRLFVPKLKNSSWGIYILFPRASIAASSCGKNSCNGGSSRW